MLIFMQCSHLNLIQFEFHWLGFFMHTLYRKYAQIGNIWTRAFLSHFSMNYLWHIFLSVSSSLLFHCTIAACRIHTFIHEIVIVMIISKPLTLHIPNALVSIQDPGRCVVAQFNTFLSQLLSHKQYVFNTNIWQKFSLYFGHLFVSDFSFPIIFVTSHGRNIDFYFDIHHKL